MAIRELVRSRLVLRIYLVGLAQMAVVAAGFTVILLVNRPERPGLPHGHATVTSELVARSLGDSAGLLRALENIRAKLGGRVTVVDPGGAVVASTAEDSRARCSDLDEVVNPGVWRSGLLRCATVPVGFPDGRAGELHFFLEARPQPPDVAPRVVPLVLLVVAISSLLLARSFTRPLRTMSEAARAFGRGDLTARAGLDRRDELGEVSRAFDEMAERVTELLRAEKELLANVSHELRTPLARIRVALDLAAEGDAAVARESLAEIAGDLDELERLIGDILTAARLDLTSGPSSTGAPPLRQQRVDVADLLAHAASRFRAAHPERPLTVDVAEDLPAVVGDPVLLRRVVENLLENAHKYTERVGEPVVLAARAGAEVEIDVVDRGVGITASDLTQVFRPFFRADRSRTRATGGLGLGLALTKRIVDAHGGSVELTSAPNEGTRARVRLPVALD